MTRPASGPESGPLFGIFAAFPTWPRIDRRGAGGSSAISSASGISEMAGASSSPSRRQPRRAPRSVRRTMRIDPRAFFAIIRWMMAETACRNVETKVAYVGDRRLGVSRELVGDVAAGIGGDSGQEIIKSAAE